MKAEITTFPYGAAEGLPVLRLDFEGGGWSTDAADAERARHDGASGLWGTWVDGLGSWEDDGLDAWLYSQDRVIALRKLGAPDWPAAECPTVLDVSEAMAIAGSIDALADFVAARAVAVPAVLDLVAVLDMAHRAPLTSALDLLADFAHPAGQSYLYAPADHPHWPLLVRAISQCVSMWSLRHL